jgi:hypothetical protein
MSCWLMIKQLAKLITKLRLEWSLINIQSIDIYWNNRDQNHDYNLQLQVRRLPLIETLWSLSLDFCNIFLSTIEIRCDGHWRIK